MNNNEWPEYKEGDIVYIERLNSKGTITARNGEYYSIELSKPLELKMLELQYITYYFDHVTYIKKIDAYVGVIRLAEKEGGSEK